MQRGRINSTETPQGWNCNSGCNVPNHCTLPRCTNVVFPQTFSGSGTVRIRASLIAGNDSEVIGDFRGT